MATEIDIANRALSKNHVGAQVSSVDGTIGSIATTDIASNLLKQFWDSARREILRLAPWTCVQTRKKLAYAARQPAKAYVTGDLIVAQHGSTYAVYRCGTAGATGPSDVIWPDSGTVSDGSVVWKFAYDLLSGIPEANITGYTYAFPLPADYINQLEVLDSYGKLVDFEIEGVVLYSDNPDPVLVYVPDSSDTKTWDPLLTEAVAMQLASAIAYPLTGSHENESAFAQSSVAVVTQAVATTRREKKQGPQSSNEWWPGLFQKGGPSSASGAAGW